MKTDKKMAPEVEPTEPDSDDYATQGHLRTLMDAEMLKEDPAKMEKVHALAGRHHKALKGIKKIKPVKSVDDLKSASNNFQKTGQSGFGTKKG